MKNSLILVKDYLPSILIDLRYSTAQNFLGRPVYKTDNCYLHPDTIEHLRRVVDDLSAHHLRLKILDAYRPLSAQRILWEYLPDPRYVADPQTGGRHTRGTALDVTLVNDKGEELEMPSAYDEFTERAHRNYQKVSTQVLYNRQLLEEIMQKHGFEGLATEWWHFDLKDFENYPVLNIEI